MLRAVLVLLIVILSGNANSVELPHLEIVRAQAHIDAWIGKPKKPFISADVDVRPVGKFDPEPIDKARITASLAKNLAKESNFQVVTVRLLSVHGKNTAYFKISQSYHAPYYLGGLRAKKAWSITTTQGRTDLYFETLAEYRRLRNLHGSDYNSNPEIDSFVSKLAKLNGVEEKTIVDAKTAVEVQLDILEPLSDKYLPLARELAEILKKRLESQ